MRKQAKNDLKSVPSVTDLELILSEIVDMKCPICIKEMNWDGRLGMDMVITLQHDRESPRIRLICGACNSHHRNLPGDLFYEIKFGLEKYCPKCKEVKPVESFSKDSHKAGGLKSTCKSCSYDSWRNWYLECDKSHYKLRKISERNSV